MVRELVFNPFGNAAALQLQDDTSGALADTDTTNLTAVTVLIDGTRYDSEDYTAEITWNATGQITLVLGGLGLEPGEHLAALVLYDATYLNGLRWPVDFTLVVRE